MKTFWCYSYPYFIYELCVGNLPDSYKVAKKFQEDKE